MEREPEIAKLGHIALTTPDIEKSLWFWKDVVGLHEVERVDDTTYLRAWGEYEHHTLSLRPDDAGRVDHIAWRTKLPEDVDAFAERIRATGIPVVELAAGEERGQGRAIRFTPPSGQTFEIYYDVEKPKPPENQRSRLLNNQYRLGGPGVAPRRIDHVNLHAPDAHLMTQWLTDLLGFKNREYIVDEADRTTASWMSVTPLVHDIAVSNAPGGITGAFNHLAYWVDNWQDVLHAADIMMENEIAMFGPGRHGISQAMFLYVLDPGSGHKLEIFSGSYLIFDPDWEPIKWRREDLNLGITWWGPKRSAIATDHHTGSVELATAVRS